MNRANNKWKKHDLMTALKERGIYDPSKVVVQEIFTPEPDEAQQKAVTVDAVLALEGDAVRGKTTVARCIMCHEAGGMGVQYGPALDGWGKTQTADVIARSIIDPSADIAHGFEATEIVTKDDKRVHGLLIQDGNPAIITSMGGVTQMIPAGKIKSKRKMKRSAMLSATQLGLTAQEVADIVAYLKAN
jgi:putative heme-binding domain-containing protein